MMTSNLPSLFCLLALMVSGGPLLAHPVPDSTQWLTYPGGDGPGKGKHIVLIADQNQRDDLENACALHQQSDLFAT